MSGERGTGTTRVGAWFSQNNTATCFGRVETMPLKLHGKVYSIEGGPWASIKPGQRGICLAQENTGRGGDLKVGTPDFGVPDKDEVLFAMKVAIAWLVQGEDVYVGCGMGHGRTGLFLACLAKVSLGSDKTIHPVDYVRAMYNPRAVETVGQREFVTGLDVSSVISWTAEVEKMFEYL